MNEKASKSEAILEAMERGKHEMEKLIFIRQEEAMHLRKNEILGKMQSMLQEHSSLERLRQTYEKGRSQAALKALDSDVQSNQLLSQRLTDKQNDKNELIQELINEEAFQKEAFRRLQLQKDAKCNRINNQIDLIQSELAQLSLVEIEKRELRIEVQQNIISEKREALTRLLVTLMQERKIRIQELSKRVSEMEARRQATIDDYWLVQYQRLLDKKPDSLISKESELEYAVTNILNIAGAQQYIPLFAKHRITIETLCQLTDVDLCKMGVSEVGVRKAILHEVRIDARARDKAASIEAGSGGATAAAAGPLTPSAPPMPDFAESTEPSAAGSKDVKEAEVEPETSPEPSAPPIQDVVARLETECIICFEKQSTVIFLYCGHLCCCGVCAARVTACPLCRAHIEQRVQFCVDTGDIDVILPATATADTTQTDTAATTSTSLHI